jgi:Methyltransferase FkbM domain
VVNLRKILQEPAWKFRPTVACTRENPEALPTLTIPDLLGRLETADLGLLKLDIEGAEEALFTKNCEEWIDHVRALIVEVHGAKAKEAVISVMTKRDFRMEQQGEKLVFFKGTTA